MRLTTSQERPEYTSTFFLVVAALLVGLALRLLLLGSKSFWLDEAFSMFFASSSPQSLFANGYDNAHPPLYYTVLHYWLPLGSSEAMLRLSSALFGSVAIWIGYLLALELGGQMIALTTIWLMALAPLLVWYSQELRSYSLLLLLGLLASLATTYMVTRPKLGWWLLFVLAMSGALYTHYVAILLVALQFGVIALLHLQERVRSRGIFLWLLGWPFVLLLYWPWLVTPGMRAFMRAVRATNLYPIEFTAVSLSISIFWAKVIISLVALLALLVALYICYLMARRKIRGWERWIMSPAVRYGVIFLFLALTLFSVIPRLYTLKKLIVELWPYGLIVIAWIFPWRSSNRLMLALFLTISLIASVANAAVIPKDQWREMAAYLVAHGKPGDSIWVSPDYQAVALNYYLEHPRQPGSAPLAPHDIAVAPVSTAMSDDKLASLLPKGQRVWLIYHIATARQSDPTHKLEQWLKAHLLITDQLHLYGIDATLYSPRP